MIPAHRKSVPLLVAGLLGLSPPVAAGGLDLPVVSASQQGTANANSAEADDASVIYYNPAGMSRLRGTRVSLTGSLFFLHSQVQDRGTTLTAQPGQNNQQEGAPATTDPTAQGRAGSYFPSLQPAGSAFITHQLDENTTIGFGAFGVAGAKLNYRSNWYGKYFIDTLDAEIVNLNPSISYRFDDKHSIGAGFSAYPAHLSALEDVDVRGINNYLVQSLLGSYLNVSPGGVLGNVALDKLGLGGLLPQLGLPLGTTYNQLPANLRAPVSQAASNVLLDQSSTASALIQMYGLGFGYNLGYMYQIDDTARIGIAFRSQANIHLRGDLNWNLADVRTNGNIPLPDTRTGQLLTAPELVSKYLHPDTTVKATIPVPARLSLGYFKQIDDRVDWMLDYTFIQSSVINEIRLKLAPQVTGGGQVNQGDGVIPLNWRDSYRLATGFNYRVDPSLLLRVGLAYDRTPIRSPEFRSPLTPDSDRFTLGLGFSKHYDKSLRVDFGYSLTVFQDASANFRSPCRGVYLEQGSSLSNDPTSCTGNGGTFKGEFSGTRINALSLQINKRL